MLEDIIFEETNKEDKFVLNYLMHLSNRMIDKRVLKIEEYLNVPKNAHDIIKKYFVEPIEEKGSKPCFSIYRKFMNMLYIAFKTFSETSFVEPRVLKESHVSFPGLKLTAARGDFLNTIVDNSLEFLQETITTNSFNNNTE